MYHCVSAVFETFRGNGSKIARSKLQLVLFETFWYNKFIPQTTFFILPQNWPKRHDGTWTPETPEMHVGTYVSYQNSNF